MAVKLAKCIMTKTKKNSQKFREKATAISCCSFLLFNNFKLLKIAIMPALYRNYCLLVIVFLFSSSCNQQSPYALLEINGEDQIGKIYLNSTSATIDSCLIKAGKSCAFKIRLDEPGFYQIATEKEVFSTDYFFLKSGDTLLITRKSNKTQVKGKAARTDSLVSSILKKYIVDNESYSKSTRNKLSPTEFTQFINTLKNKRLQLIDSTLSNEYHSNFINYLKSRVILHWANDYWYYLKYHNLYAHGKWEYLSKDSVTYNFHSKTKDKISDYSKFHFSPEYKRYIAGYVNNIYQECLLKEDSTYISSNIVADKFKIIKDSLKDVDREIAIANLSENFSMLLAQVRPEIFYYTIEPIKSFFEDNHTNSLYHKSFLKNYQAIQKIAPKQKAPDFQLPSLQDSLISLSDFRGKLVYINFWGTWCGPCIKQIPHYKKLYQKYKNDNITFLNVALEYGDKDIRRWKKFIVEHDFPGVHVVAEKQFNNQSIRLYSVTFAPTYMLIDQAGLIIDPRADSPKNIIDQLNKFL